MKKRHLIGVPLKNVPVVALDDRFGLRDPQAAAGPFIDQARLTVFQIRRMTTNDHEPIESTSPIASAIVVASGAVTCRRFRALFELVRSVAGTSGETSARIFQMFFFLSA